MKQSEIIEKIREDITASPIEIYSAEYKRQVMEPKEVDVNAAILKLCTDWNASEKSRQFVKHLIKAFMYTTPELVLDYSKAELKSRKNVCSILNYRLMGVEELQKRLNKFATKKATIQFRDPTHTTFTTYEIHALENLRFKVFGRTEICKSFRVPDSTCTLSEAALIGLQKFAELSLQYGEKDVIYVLKNTRDAKLPKTEEKKQENTRTHQAALSQFMDKTTMDALMNIK